MTGQNSEKQTRSFPVESSWVYRQSAYHRWSRCSLWRKAGPPMTLGGGKRESGTIQGSRGTPGLWAWTMVLVASHDYSGTSHDSLKQQGFVTRAKVNESIFLLFHLPLLILFPRSPITHRIFSFIPEDASVCIEIWTSHSPSSSNPINSSRPASAEGRGRRSREDAIVAKERKITRAKRNRLSNNSRSYPSAKNYLISTFRFSEFIIVR